MISAMSSYINFKNCGQMAANSPLTQQSSIYALTLDELQTTLGGGGKDFGSMNMDELLKNIWTAEETQSLTSSSRTLSQKTVDEVWRELHKENGGHGGFGEVGLIKEADLQPQQKQPALGEMTLEEFLQKAGVVAEKPQIQPNGRHWNDGLFGDDGSGFAFGFKNPNQNQRFHQQTVVIEGKNEVDNLQGVRSSQPPKPPKLFPKQAAFNFSSSQVNNAQLGNSINGVSVIGKTDHLINTSMVQAKAVGGHMSRSPPDLFPNSNLDTSPSPPAYGYGEGGVQEKRRGGPLEKVVERRRKRMIKNRESAARSRARKQAYTLELEAEVAKLKELNHELQKKQEEIMESQNFQMPEKMKLWGSRGLCLRRTLTGPW
ncbi:ABSCISIC ACID-INSENSITIVE 5-like protein 3 [Cynara cardunculus var. scolymus]|uniref:ABSCISIC ACID-INSENSITIVE 5-like protein 3 n=1 Tax=Cynara cardunculus var. scolymus TaxID=59895 RepID=UPI000D628FBA|nr:ABSCISIC ACID-INSENSITIVE 5-like protein 3 [Cynara cardunculus var. scolymus]XP_024960145.1 ABSCISIC ACID-INSENSITIVE 5-like protein 3 [Cynara cardunculus var. scolymus]